MDAASNTRRRWLGFAALGAAHLGVLFLGPLVTDEAGLFPIHRPQVAWLMALFPPHWLIGAAAAVGIWVALGGGRWFVRLGIGILAWVWMAGALLVGELLTPNWPYELSGLFVAAGLAAVASVVLTAFARVFFGWRLTHDGAPVQERCDRFQFRLAHLVAALTLIAVTLALMRLLNQRFVHQTMSYLLLPRMVLDWLGRLSVQAWCPALIVIATVLLVLGKRPAIHWLVPVFVLLVMLDALIQYLEFAVRNRIGWRYFGEVFERLGQERTIADGAILLSVLVSAAVFRALGYRLGRGTAAAQTGDTKPAPA